MKTLCKTILIFFFLTIGFFLSTNAQEYEQFRYWTNNVGLPKTWVFGNLPQNEITEIKKRWEDIGESLNTTSNPFAGTYFQSGNRGYYLRWSPEKGFVYVYYYEYFVVDASYGKVSVTSSEVKFISEREMQNEDGRKLKTPTVWIPVGQGNFFIKGDAIESFVNFYAGFGEFNGFPRKWYCDCSPFAERQKPISDDKLPIVPIKYQKFIKNPINAEIISIGKRAIVKESKLMDVSGKASHTSVTINAGRKQGVTRGLMFFILDGNDNNYQILQVKRISANTSQGIVARYINEKGDEAFDAGWDSNLKETIYKSFPRLRLGAKVTTSPLLAGL